MNDKKLYIYYGSILNNFGKEIASNYRAETYAVSQKKATSNILYSYKIKNGLAANAKVSFVGKITEQTG